MGASTRNASPASLAPRARPEVTGACVVGLSAKSSDVVACLPDRPLNPGQAVIHHRCLGRRLATLVAP